MKKQKCLLLSLLILLLLMSACGKAAVDSTPEPTKQTPSTSKDPEPKEEATPDTDEGTEPEPNENDESADEKEDPMNQPEAKERYYVNPHNFRIYPVDEENEKKIALLTFDDGPRGETTRKIIDTLDKHQAKSIWFVNGFNYEGSEEKQQRFIAYIKELHEKGHLIANHTYMHPFMPDLPEEQQKEEILKLNELLKEITGETPKYYRPPNGASTPYQIQLTNELNMQWMNWSVGSLDWQYPEDGQKVYDQVMSTMHNGANILFHANKESTAEVLDDILTKLKAEGYHFVLPTEIELVTEEQPLNR